MTSSMSRLFAVCLFTCLTGALVASDPSSIDQSQSDRSIAVLGITHGEPSPETFDAGLDPTLGREIWSVRPGSTAAQLGIQEGDVIVGINGLPVTNARSMRHELINSAAGDPISLRVWRDGQIREMGGDIIPGDARWRSGDWDEEELADEREYRQEQSERIAKKLTNFSEDFLQVQALRKELDDLKEEMAQAEVARKLSQQQQDQQNANPLAWILHWQVGNQH